MALQKGIGKTIVNMACNWLASAELPPTYWFYAVRHAAEVCNNFHITLEDKSLITPFNWYMQLNHI
jgi:hypothetical protein